VTLSYGDGYDVVLVKQHVCVRTVIVILFILLEISEAFSQMSIAEFSTRFLSPFLWL